MYFSEIKPPPQSPAKNRKAVPIRAAPPATTPMQPQKIKTTKLGYKQAILFGGIALAFVIATGGGIYLLRSRNKGPLPTDVTKNAGFTIYFPSPIPPGYTVKEGSAKLNGGSLFYTLQNGGNTLTVSEQAIPPNPPDLNHLIGFTTFSTLAGNAAIGKNLNRSIAILLTNTTLVTVQGNASTPQVTVGNLARAMNSLPQ